MASDREVKFADKVGSNHSADGSDKPIDQTHVLQLLTHIPDQVIAFNQFSRMPATKEYIGVVLFADVSGFTALTEKYSSLQTTGGGTTGTDKLSATLNAYIGKIVQEIIQRGGDIVKFAGDAILATWKCSEIGHNTKNILNKAINCSVDIQKKCDNHLTDVGVLLRVKLAIAVGKMCLTYVGVPDNKHFDLSGAAIDLVGETEKRATPGSIILSQMSWANCDQKLFNVESLENGEFFRVVTDSQTSSNLVEKKNLAISASKMMTFDQSERVITSPLDAVIDMVIDFRKDMPKALICEEDDQVRDHLPTSNIVNMQQDHQSKKKTKKFDRVSMTVNLKTTEIECLRSYVPGPVLQKIDNGQDLNWLSEMRRVSVLFINMKLPDEPNEASDALQKAFEVISDACVKFKGNVNKVFGFDKGCTFVVIFGLPGQKHEDDPVRALKGAQHIFDSLHAISEICNESIGVTTGLAFCGVVGHKDRHEYTVIGSKVNMAARLMMYYPGLLTCDEETYESSVNKLRKQDFFEMPFIQLKGMKDPGVVREYNPSSNSNESEIDHEYPILGRTEELARFQLILKEVAATRNSQVIVIKGDAGIGKSRLLEELITYSQDMAFKVVDVDVDSAMESAPQVALSFILRHLIDATEGGLYERESQLVRIAGGRVTVNDLSLLNDMLGTALPCDSSTHLPVDSDERNKQINKVLCKVINAVTECHPCLVAIDNARRIDEQTWQAFDSIFKNVNNCIFAVAIRSSELMSSKSSAVAKKVLDCPSNYNIELTGLEAENMADLACQLLDVSEIPVSLQDIVQSKSQGVPSWCKQLVKDLMYSEVIQIVSKANLAVRPDTPPPSIPGQRHQKQRRSSVKIPSISPLKEHYDEIKEEEEEGKQLHLQIATSRKPSSPRVSRNTIPSSKESKSSENTLGSVSSSTNDGPAGRASSANDALRERPAARRISVIRKEFNSQYGKSQLELPGPKNSHVLSTDAIHIYKPSDYFHASPRAVDWETDEICIITPGVDISEIMVPSSVKEMFVSRLDKMSANEQTIVKCASVLGQSFTRELLRAIIPTNCVNILDTTLYNLGKEMVFQCGSLTSSQRSSGSQTDMTGGGRTHQKIQGRDNAQVLCSCHANEGYECIDLTKTNTFADNKKRVCLFFNFSNTFVQEAAYALWLEEQRKVLQEKAAMYLEKQSHKCRSCGGGSFIPRQGGDLVAKPSTATFFPRRDSGRGRNFAQRQSIAYDALSTMNTGRKLSNRFSIAQDMDESVIKNHKKFLKQIKSQHFKDYEVLGTQGEANGMALIEITQQLMENETWNAGKRIVRFTQRRKKNINQYGNKFAAKAMLSDLRTTVEETNMHYAKVICNSRRRIRHGTTSTNPNNQIIDLSKCRCNEVLAAALSRLVLYWRGAGNILKTFRYLADAAANSLNLGLNSHALTYLEEVNKIIEETKGNEELFLTDEDRAKVESLTGQVLLNMGHIDEGIQHLHTALKLLGEPQPSSKMRIKTRTMKARLVQMLHRNMPGVFMNNDHEDLLLEQSRCLAHLTDAYIVKKDMSRAYLACLEQLNITEEAKDYWADQMSAYTNMVRCCMLAGKMSLGYLYEGLALKVADQASLRVEDVSLVGKLHEVALSFRLHNNQLQEAINCGFKAKKVAASLNDYNLITSYTPLFVYALVLKNRMQSCVEVLADLKAAARFQENQLTHAWYHLCVLEVGMTTGEWAESWQTINGFCAEYTQNLAVPADDFAIYCLHSGMCVWLAYTRRHEMAAMVFQLLVKQEPTVKDECMFTRALVRQLEYTLLALHAEPVNPQLAAECSRRLADLTRRCRQNQLVQPRLLHLRAYFQYLKGRTNRSLLLLEDALVAAKAYSVLVEVGHVMASKQLWSKKSASGDGNDHQVAGMTLRLNLPNRMENVKNMMRNQSIVY